MGALPTELYLTSLLLFLYSCSN